MHFKEKGKTSETLDRLEMILKELNVTDKLVLIEPNGNIICVTHPR